MSSSPPPSLATLVTENCRQLFCSVMLKTNHQVRDIKEFSLSCVHKSHGVYGSFGFFPSNQVLASSALARVESPRTRWGGGGRGEGRRKLRGSGRMELFFRGTPGTGEDDRAGGVTGAHGAVGSRTKTRWPRCASGVDLSAMEVAPKCHPGWGLPLG